MGNEGKNTVASLKAEMEAMRASYEEQLEAYGLGSYLNYTVESAIHAEQFDKVMNYLLEYTVDENTNAITYAHVKYNAVESTEGENK